MNVEGGLIGSVGGVASAVGSSIVNEGPVAPGFLENTMPLTLNRFNSVGEIIFNPEAKAHPQTVSVADTDLPSGAEAVDIAEQWLGISSQPQNDHYILDRGVNGNSQHRVIEPIARPMDFAWTRPEVFPFSNPEPLVKPKNELKIHPNTSQIELAKSAQENLVGQVIDETPTFGEKEEVEELKLKDLLDEETALQRVYEIGKAIDLAETEAKMEGVDEIEGSRILKFLRLHIGLISQIARKIRKDGSLDETLEGINARKFSSKDQAKEQSSEIVAQKEPVKRGKEGKTVKEGAVERVFKYHQVIRSPNEEVVTRVVKKQQIQAGNSKEVQVLALEPAGSKEMTIEDTGLAEIFKEAA